MLSLPVAGASAWDWRRVPTEGGAVGNFGPYAALRLRIQGGSTPLEMLFGGRREVFYSFLDPGESHSGARAERQADVAGLVTADRLLADLG